MPSINVDLHYFTHPKTNRLVGRLGRGAEVLPLKLWCYCGKYHSSDGRLTGYSSPEIESIVGWWGNKGTATKALIEVGYLSEIDGGYQVHEWDEWQGHIHSYQIRAKQAAMKRWNVDATSIASSIASSNRQAMPVQCSALHTPLRPPRGAGKVRKNRAEQIDSQLAEMKAKAGESA